MDKRIILITDDCDGWSAHNRCKIIDKYVSDYETVIMAGGVVGSREKVNNYLNRPETLLHIHYMAGMGYFYDILRKNPQRYIITIGNERSYLTGYGVSRQKIDDILENAIITSSVSKKIADTINAVYIPNGVDFKLFPEGREVTVGYVGTDKENKNYPLLKKVCDDLGVRLHALLYGKNQVPQEKMHEEYSKMDLLVHPSITEGCNNVILEAMAMNVPVYMTKQGIWHDLVGYVNFIEPTYESIAGVVKKYKARELIEKNFQWKELVVFYKRLYDEAFLRLYHLRKQGN